jgi:hypothetical protein
MDDTGYRVVFDVTQVGYKAWTFPAFGLGFIFLGIFVVPILQRLNTRASGRSPLFQVFFVGFALLWTVFSLLGTASDYLHARAALVNGNAQVVTGTVDNFKPMPVSGHAMERFTVGGASFSYSDYIITAGFNQTESHGGPIHAGEQVRIWYLPQSSGNEILKLAIKD